MVVVEKRSVIKAFYYLMAVDGNVSDSELDKLNEIGIEIDSEHYNDYKESVISECLAHINTADDDEYYDVIQEGLDDTLLCIAEDKTQGVPLRLLVWDMLVMAFVNDEFALEERKLIKHVVRVTKMDKSIFLEMEHLLKTAVSVDKEKERISSSNKPYAEVRPIVEELEKRQRIIMESAMALIEDEVEYDNPYVESEKTGVINDVVSKVGDKINPIATDVGAKTKELIGKTTLELGKKFNQTTNGLGEKLNKSTAGLGAKAKGLLRNKKR
jgi:hypothetical protein